MRYANPCVSFYFTLHDITYNLFVNYSSLFFFSFVVVTAKLVPLAYGIKKLQISCVVEDDKVSTDDLEEQIVAYEDYVRFAFF